MASRARLVVALGVVAGILVGAAASQPPVGTSVYTVRVDPRLCPSPLCGGYWVARANGARTPCANEMRRGRCYVAKAVDAERHPFASALPDGALARASIEAWDHEGLGKLGVLVVAVVYAPAGTAPGTGGYYRVVDTGARCVRAPCFSYRATRVNGSTRTAISGVDLAASKASAPEIARAEAALSTKNGLLVRGGFARSADGGRVLRVSRLYLRAPRPPA